MSASPERGDVGALVDAWGCAEEGRANRAPGRWLGGALVLAENGRDKACGLPWRCQHAHCAVCLLDRLVPSSGLVFMLA